MELWPYTENHIEIWWFATKIRNLKFFMCLWTCTNNCQNWNLQFFSFGSTNVIGFHCISINRYFSYFLLKFEGNLLVIKNKILLKMEKKWGFLGSNPSKFQACISQHSIGYFFRKVHPDFPQTLSIITWL